MRKYFCVLFAIMFSATSFAQNSREWTRTSLPHVFSEQITSNDNLLVVGTPHGIFYSDDEGQTWKEDFSGFPTTSPFITDLTYHNGMFFASSTEGVHSSLNGKEWDKISNGINSERMYKIKAVGRYMLTSSEDEDIYLSKNNGSGWEKIDLGNIANNVRDFGFTSNLKDSHLFVLTDKLLKWNDKSLEWTLEEDGQNGELKGRMFRTETMDGTIFVGTSEGLFKSLNNGENWTKVEIPIESENQLCELIAVDGNKIATIIGRKTAISDNRGLTWQIINMDEIETHLTDLAFHNGDLYLGTHGDGLLKLESSITNVIENNEIDNLNVYYDNKSEEIRTNSEEIINKFEIYNLKGELCYKVYGKKNYFTTDASEYVAGVYLIKLEVKDRVFMRKVVIY